MVESYRLELAGIIDRLDLSDEMAATIECKHFFSGAAAYVDGTIFMSLTPVGLALKLSPERCAALLDGDARPLRYFANGPIKKNYVLLPDAIAGDDRQLRELVCESASYCSLE